MVKLILGKIEFKNCGEFIANILELQGIIICEDSIIAMQTGEYLVSNNVCESYIIPEKYQGKIYYNSNVVLTVK